MPTTGASVHRTPAGVGVPKGNVVRTVTMYFDKNQIPAEDLSDFTPGTSFL